MVENIDGYRRRIADKLLEEKLDAMGAVLIEGPKACGKTTTAEQQAKSILYMDDPEQMKQNLQLAETNIRRLLQGDTPRLIDEWQIAPQLCDAVVHLRNGNYGLVEIKLGGDTRIEEGATNLNSLAKIIDTTKMKKPSFKMVLTAVGQYAYMRTDGVMVIPIGCLKD